MSVNRVHKSDEATPLLGPAGTTNTITIPASVSVSASVTPAASAPSGLTQLVRVVIGVLLVLTCSLPIIGFQAFLPMLKDAGVYHGECDDGTPLDDVCHKQTLLLDWMFNGAVSLINYLVLAVIMGMEPKGLGNRMTSLSGLLVMAAGFLILALSTDHVPLWLLGYWAVAGGGTFAAFPPYAKIPFMVPEAFRNITLFIIYGALDASSGMPYVLLQLHRNYGYSFKTLMLAYGAVPLAFVPASFVLFPSRKCELAAMQAEQAAKDRGMSVNGGGSGGGSTSSGGGGNKINSNNRNNIEKSDKTNELHAARPTLFPVPDECDANKSMLRKTLPFLRTSEYLVFLSWFSVMLTSK